MRRDDREAEGSALLMRRSPKDYRGFESLSLRKENSDMKNIVKIFYILSFTFIIESAKIKLCLHYFKLGGDRTHDLVCRKHEL